MPFNVANEMNRIRGIQAEQNLADMEDYVDDRNLDILPTLKDEEDVNECQRRSV